MKSTAELPPAVHSREQIERWINQRTSGRVHALCVETDNGRVIVHGITGTYYVRQLALAAVLESLEDCGCLRPEVVLDIEVFA